MATLTINLPDDRIALLREEAEASGSSVDGYIDRLLSRETKARTAKKRLEKLLIEGLESGPAEPMTCEDWESIERNALRRLEAERKAR